KNIQKAEQRILLLREKPAKRVGIHTRNRNRCPDTVSGNDRQRKEDAPLELWNLENIAERIIEFGSHQALTTSAVPPAFSIFSFAEAEKACACTVNAFDKVPSPKTFTLSQPLTRPASFKEAKVTEAFALKLFSKSPTLTTPTLSSNIVCRKP